MKQMQYLLLAAIFAAFAVTAGAKSGKADLVVDRDQIQPYLSIETFAGDDCEVLEGCATTGTRVLLRFTAYTKNAGRRDVKLGKPSKHPEWFTKAECHGHYHFNGYMNYRLLNESGAAAAGFKTAFCLEDLDRWTTASRPKARYSCENQGIQAGWADVYDGSLPCQYIDVTDVLDGDYVLELHVNPDAIIKESNYENNVTTIGLHLVKPTFEPPVPADNDDFLSATVIGPGIYHGDASLATSDGIVVPSCGSGKNADVWFRYTPATSGVATISTCGAEAFDTVLTLLRDDGGSLTEIECNDDTPCNVSSVTSQVTEAVNAHVSYVIRLSSFSGKGGKYQLTLTGPLAEILP
jgi:hypothetical protein